MFYRRGVIESWGRGTLKIAELTDKAGLPRPQIEDANGFVTVRFLPSRYIPPTRVGHNLSDRERRVLGVLGAANRRLSLREVVAVLDPPVLVNTVKEDLQTLKLLQLVATEGRGVGAKWYMSSPR